MTETGSVVAPTTSYDLLAQATPVRQIGHSYEVSGPTSGKRNLTKGTCVVDDSAKDTTLSGRRALVTGAAGALGQAIAQAMSNAGARIVAAERPGVDLSSTLDLCGSSAESLYFDLLDEDQINGAIAGRDLEIVVNCAGVEGAAAPLATLGASEFDTVLNINLRAAFLIMKAAYPALRETRNASVINIASTSALMGQPDACAYVASKHGLVGLTRAAAAEWGADRIRVNAVCPGPLETPMMASFEAARAESNVRTWYEIHTPLRRYGYCSEVAALVTFLASDGARFITGATIPVDGGLSAVGRPASKQTSGGS